MYFVALATDYDGTLAKDGRVNAATIDALKGVRASGRKLILVTGRDLPDLQRAFPSSSCSTSCGRERCPPLQPGQESGDAPGRAAVAGVRRPGCASSACRHYPLVAPSSLRGSRTRTAVLRAIRDLALELHIVFNKGAVMVLPGNVNKAWGLKHALKPFAYRCTMWWASAMPRTTKRS
jgi:hypothetical protein